MKIILIISLILVILYPSNFLISKSFHLVYTTTPFFKYFEQFNGMLNIPLSGFLIFVFGFIFISKKLYKNNESNILFICIFYIFVSFLYVNIFLTYYDTRFFKNLIQCCILIFCLIISRKLYIQKKFQIYKYYNFVLMFICLFNLFNLIVFFHSSENAEFSYFSNMGFLAGYLYKNITHYADYFPFIVFLSLACDFIFFKKDKFLISFFIFIKFIWYFGITLYSLELDYFIFNKGLFFSLLFFLITSLIFFILKLKISRLKIFSLIILLNLIYYFSLIILNDYLDSSLKDRAESFFYLHNQLDFKNIFFPFFIKYGFEHNLHNDFWDLYFSYGIIFFLVYLFLSKILFEIYQINKYSFLILFSVFCFGSLVQNNLLNLYTIINFSLVLFLANKEKI